MRSTVRAIGQFGIVKPLSKNGKRHRLSERFMVTCRPGGKSKTEGLVPGLNTVRHTNN
jgi:hypothetical protein